MNLVDGNMDVQVIRIVMHSTDALVIPVAQAGTNARLNSSQRAGVRVFAWRESDKQMEGLIAFSASILVLCGQHLCNHSRQGVSFAIRYLDGTKPFRLVLLIGDIAHQTGKVGFAEGPHGDVPGDHRTGDPVLAAKTVMVSSWHYDGKHDLAHFILGIKDSVEHGVYGGFTKLSASLIVGEPKFQQSTKATQVAIDAGQFPHLLIIDDAVDWITLTDFAQVAGDAHAGLLRLAFNDLPLFLENRDTQVVFSFLLGVDQLLCQAWIHRSLFQGSTSVLKPAAAGRPRRAGCPLSTPVRIRYSEDR